MDLTLVNELQMGTPVDATPEQSDGVCWFDADVDRLARHNRTILARALGGVGLVKLPDRVVALVLWRPLLGVAARG